MGSRLADELKELIASAEAMMYVSYFEGFGNIEVVRTSGNDFIHSYLTIQKVIIIIR